MTFIPGGGGGGSVSTSNDVALNNISNGDVLSYDSTISKWKNNNFNLYPLGCAENPITDSAAARPTEIPCVWWRVTESPVNALEGDWVFITNSTTSVIYYEKFNTTTANWATKENASAVTHEVNEDADTTPVTIGSLSWIAATTGTTQIRASALNRLIVDEGTSYTASIAFKNGAVSARDARLNIDAYSTSNAYISTFVVTATTVTSGAGWVTLTIPFTPGIGSGITKIELSPTVFGADGGDKFWVDNAKVVK